MSIDYCNSCHHVLDLHEYFTIGNIERKDYPRVCYQDKQCPCGRRFVSKMAAIGYPKVTGGLTKQERFLRSIREQHYVIYISEE